MLSRRELGGKIAAGAAVVLATGVAQGAVRKSSSEDVTKTGIEGGDDIAALPVSPEGERELDCGPNTDVEAKAPWQLLSPLTVGSSLGHGWTLAALSGAVGGSCVVTLENKAGRQSRVHVFRNDGSPNGLVYTRNFDLVVMNGGVGDLETEEGLAQAVATLAHTLAGNEKRDRTVVASLVPHAERLSAAEQSGDRGLR
jgi:hypothetical protein